jgi:diaminopimelate epimerase
MLEFYKYHGLGNDFIVIDNMDGLIVLSKEQIIFLCDRHKGIGADAVILIESSQTADCFMNYINNDGSLAEMCGNGARCVAKFLKDEILPKNNARNSFKIDTRAGIKDIKLLDDATFSVNMGQPIFSSVDFPDQPLELEGLLYYFVSMGNPHAVAFVEDLDKYDLLALGPKIENNSNFPNKINVELAEKITDDYYKVKVWERGCGETLACGTGACAVYAIIAKYCVRQDLTQEVTLEFPGGNLYLSENQEGQIILRGPAVCVFKGEIKL